jgi:hypothetical protein
MSPRLERKYGFDTIDFGKVLFWLKTNKDHYTKENERDVIHSIYFDTPDFRFYEDNLSGNTERLKIRFRWYSNTNRDVKLELKKRSFDTGTKDEFNVNDPEIVNFLRNLNHKNEGSNDKLTDYLYKVATEHQISVILALRLKPTLYTTYKREYFSASLYKRRITIDYDIKYGMIGSDKILNDSQCLVETKSSVTVTNQEYNMNQFPLFPNSLGPLAKNKIEQFHNIGLTQIRNSKYCSGVSKLMENGFYNLKLEPYYTGL